MSTKLKFLADVHISPITVKLLQNKGYDIIRITDRLPASASDNDIIQLAQQELTGPSIVSLRIMNAKPEMVAKILITVLPLIESELDAGAIVSINEKEYRRKPSGVFHWNGTKKIVMW